MAILEWLERLSGSDGAGVLIPAALFAISVAVFAYAVFNLSRVMSVRNVLGIDLSGLRRRAREGRNIFWLIYGVGYLVSYGVVFPTLAYVWFTILVILLGFMYNDKTPDDLLFISVSILAAVRVTAYHSPDLARDIAKILPFGLLGVFLVNLGDFDYGKSIALLTEAGKEERIAFFYWLYISIQELVLRVTQSSITGLYGLTSAKAKEQYSRLIGRWRGGSATDSSEDQT